MTFSCLPRVAPFFALLLSAPLGLHGQRTVLLKDVRVIDGRGLVSEAATVVIVGQTIQGISQNSVVDPTATVIDGDGLTLLPGLIDAHVHLLYQYHVQNDSSLRQFMAETLPNRLRKYLEHGVTSVMSTGDHWPEILEVRRQIEERVLVGPRLFLVGPVFSAADGHPGSSVCAGNPWCREHLAAEVLDEAEARRKVREVARQNADAIKVVYDRTFRSLNNISEQLLAVIIDEAHKQGLPTVVHVGLADEGTTALELQADALVHVPKDEPTQFQRSKLAEALLARRTTAVTTLSVKAPYSDSTGRQLEPFGGPFSERVAGELQHSRANVAFLADRGVPLVLGTDTPMLDPVESVYREIDQLREAGLTPLQIIQTFTRNAALHPGMSSDLGSIEPGKVADLILVAGDPLVDVSALQRVVLVMKDGEVVINRRR